MKNQKGFANLVLIGVVVLLVVVGGYFVWKKNHPTIPVASQTIPIYAEEKAMIEASINKQFGINWEGYTDACGYNSLTQIDNVIRTSNGYKVDIEYLCGMVVQGTKPSKLTVYVSNSGIVTGVPAPKQ